MVSSHLLNICLYTQRSHCTHPSSETFLFEAVIQRFAMTKVQRISDSGVFGPKQTAVSPPPRLREHRRGIRKSVEAEVTKEYCKPCFLDMIQPLHSWVLFFQWWIHFQVVCVPVNKPSLLMQTSIIQLGGLKDDSKAGGCLMRRGFPEGVCVCVCVCVKLSQRILFIAKEKVIVPCNVCKYIHNQETV